MVVEVVVCVYFSEFLDQSLMGGYSKEAFAMAKQTLRPQLYSSLGGRYLIPSRSTKVLRVHSNVVVQRLRL